MIKKYDKMRRIQSKAIKLLKEVGFITHLNPHTRFNKDMFGLYDVLCIASKNIIDDKRGILAPHGDVVWVQIKTGYVNHKDRYYMWCKKYKQRCLLMQYLENNKWNIVTV